MAGVLHAGAVKALHSPLFLDWQEGSHHTDQKQQSRAFPTAGWRLGQVTGSPMYLQRERKWYGGITGSLGQELAVTRIGMYQHLAGRWTCPKPCYSLEDEKNVAPAFYQKRNLNPVYLSSQLKKNTKYFMQYSFHFWTLYGTRTLCLGVHCSVFTGEGWVAFNKQRQAKT